MKKGIYIGILLFLISLILEFALVNYKEKEKLDQVNKIITYINEDLGSYAYYLQLDEKEIDENSMTIPLESLIEDWFMVEADSLMASLDRVLKDEINFGQGGASGIDVDRLKEEILKNIEIVSDDKREIIIKGRVKINKKDMIFYRLYAIYRGDY